MLFKKDKQIKEYEDLIVKLKRQNDALRMENARLQTEHKSTNYFKEEYAKLCEDMRELKAKYVGKMETLNEIENEYKKHLEILKRKH